MGCSGLLEWYAQGSAVRAWLRERREALCTSEMACTHASFSSCDDNHFGRHFSPLSSCRSPQAALNLSYRSDRVTRL